MRLRTYLLVLFLAALANFPTSSALGESHLVYFEQLYIINILLFLLLMLVHGCTDDPVASGTLHVACVDGGKSSKEFCMAYFTAGCVDNYEACQEDEFRCDWSLLQRRARTWRPNGHLVLLSRRCLMSFIFKNIVSRSAAHVMFRSAKYNQD